MEWQVLLDKDFRAWLYEQTEDFREEVFAMFLFLKKRGPSLGRPQADTLEGSEFSNMKELRIQFRGRLYRLLFAFDPKRQAIVLVGGDKGGDKRWYKKNIPIADKRYQRHLDELSKEGRGKK